MFVYCTDVHLLALGFFIHYLVIFCIILEFFELMFVLLDVHSIYIVFTLLTANITLGLTTNFTLIPTDKPWTVVAIFVFDVQMAGNSETKDPVQHEAVDYQSCDDILLTIQRSTVAVNRIYNDLILKPKSEFTQYLSESNNVIELRYIGDITFSILKRKKPSTQYGNLVERRTTGNVKDTLLKDIHTILMFGEGSISFLLKSLFKTDRPVTSFGTQTGLCIEPPTATIFYLDSLKSQLLEKIDDLRNEFLCTSELECNTPPVVGKPPCVVNSPPVDVTSAKDIDAVNSTQGPTNPQKILIAGDSLFHRLKQHKMKVLDIETLKLTQTGDNLDGTFSRIRNFISRRADTNFDIVMQAGTNDLNKPSVSPQSLTGKLKQHVNDMKSFSNVFKIFLCKVPPVHVVINIV